MSIKNTENPAIWYPCYGSWLIALVVEAILFTLCITNGLPRSPFVYAQTTLQACRMLILVLLSTVLLTQTFRSTNADEESASLLGLVEIQIMDHSMSRWRMMVHVASLTVKI